MISWTDEALNRALDAWWRSGRCERRDMRRALDAAVTAQKKSGIHDVTDYMNGMADGYEKGRAEALEEAARVAETNAESDLAYGRRYPDEYHKMEQRAHRGRTIAAAIRALKETKG